MCNRYEVSAWLLIGFVATAAAMPARAQEPKPESDSPTERPTIEDPAVLAVLQTKPGTPVARTRAAKILADLGRPTLAKGYLQQVLQAQLDQQQLAGLADQLGSAMFVEMSTRSDLAPEGQQLAKAVLTAASRQSQDPKRIAGLISQLQDPSAAVRSGALAGLQKARSAAVGPLISVLADPSRAAEQANARAALVLLGSDALGPLTAILEAPDTRLVAQAIQALADSDARQLTHYLLAPCASEKSQAEVRAAAAAALKRWLGCTPTGPEAAEMLAQEARKYFDRKQPLRADSQNRVAVWSWDAAKKQAVAKEYLAEDASRVIAARLAREAYSLAADDDEIRLLHLATLLEAAAYENGPDKPLPGGQGTAMAKVAGFGVGIVEDLLEYALAHDRPVVAAAAVQILGRQGKAEELLFQGAQPAALARAARAADRRLRFAAVEAIIKLQPDGPFAGSSYVPEALRFFAASSGTRRVLIAGPITEASQRLAGYLGELGYDVATAVTGRDLIRRVIASPDYELVLVDARLQRPTVAVLLQQLRHDCRTASLPVGVITPAGCFERAERATRDDPLAEAFPRPHTAETGRWQLERLVALAGREIVPYAERQQQAAQALEWLASLSSRPQKAFDLQHAQQSVLDALYVPHLSTRAVAVLRNLGTPQSQKALVDLASRWTQPLEVRSAAVTAFRENVQRHGILLTSDQILLQYDRQNQSESRDRATQEVLGLILDSIEAATRPLRANDKG